MSGLPKNNNYINNDKSHDSWLFLFLTFTKKKNGDFQAVFFKEKLDKGLEPTKQSLIAKLGKQSLEKARLMPVY